jgi:hypothetical protein
MVHVIIPCVNYDDFLELTLPSLLRFGIPTTIVTSPTDTKTIALAKQFHLATVETNAWTANNATFNKSAALNRAIAQIISNSGADWLLLLDADIILTFDPRLVVSALLPHTLYSVERRLCVAPEQLKAYASGQLSLSQFPLYEVPIINGKAWGRRPTKNPVALSGYFHLWNWRHTKKTRLPNSSTAATYDVDFALRFGTRRANIVGHEVLHIGPIKTNWRGRTSQRWDLEGLSVAATL